MSILLPAVATLAGAAVTALPAAHLVMAARRERDRALYQAKHDELTSLPNRRHLYDTYAAGGGRYAVTLIDVDRFKEINDVYGHATGDSVIIAVAEELAEIASMYDGFVARLGGDEFVLLLPIGEHQHAVDDAPQVVADIFAFHWVGAVPSRDVILQVKISAGVCIHPQPSIDGALALADEALYEAKHQGRDRYWVNRRPDPVANLAERHGPRRRDQRNLAGVHHAV